MVPAARNIADAVIGYDTINRNTGSSSDDRFELEGMEYKILSVLDIQSAGDLHTCSVIQPALASHTCNVLFTAGDVSRLMKFATKTSRLGATICNWCELTLGWSVGGMHDVKLGPTAEPTPAPTPAPIDTPTPTNTPTNASTPSPTASPVPAPSPTADPLVGRRLVSDRSLPRFSGAADFSVRQSAMASRQATPATPANSAAFRCASNLPSRIPATSRFQFEFGFETSARDAGGGLG